MRISRIYHDTQFRHAFGELPHPRQHQPPPKANFLLLWNPDLRRYFFHCSFATRHIPKNAGFSWDPLTKHWWTKDPRCAFLLRHYADPQTLDQLTKHAGFPAE